MKTHKIGDEAGETLSALDYEVLGFCEVELEVVRYDEKLHRRAWEDFIRRSGNGNLFQTRRFLDYHPVDRFVDHSLLVYQGQRLVAVCAAEESNGQWSSHRFTSHAGLAVQGDLSTQLALAIVQSVLGYAKNRGWTFLMLRFPPDALSGNGQTAIQWALGVFGFAANTRELAWIIMPTHATEQDLLADYHHSVRRGLKKSQNAGLIFRSSTEYDDYWTLLELNLERNYNVAPTHSLEELHRLLTLCPDEIKLWVVTTPTNEIVAGALVFEVSQSAAHAFYFAQDYECQILRPMFMLCHGLASHYSVHNNKRLNLGVITARGASEINVGLSRFKSNFGATPSIRRSFTLSIEV